MPNCSRCGTTLSVADQAAGLCPRCGTECAPTASAISPPLKPATVADVRIDQTMDLGSGESMSPSAEQSAPASLNPGTVPDVIHAGTIDLGPAAPSAGQAGLADAHQLQSMNLSMLFSGGDLADAPADPVMPSGATGSAAGSGEVKGKGTAGDGANIAATFESDQVGSSLVDRLSMAWGDQFEAPVNPRVTLKGKEATGARSDQTLVINSRAVRDTSKPGTGTPLGGPPKLADYELLSLLGEGGMGVVYTARQASIDRTVAVKMLKPAMARNRDLQQKFLSEAVVTGDLDHPNIVPMYDLGKNEAGDLFYAMKKVQGTPWSKAIAAKSQQENIEILLKAADAVAFAHSRGVIHRDLKPENIMLGEFGEVLVMDWGLAYSTADFRKSASITQTHSMGGSPAYMAPEMAMGPINQITFASDIYLLGAILYEILTGRPPHSGSNVSQCLMAAARNDILPTDKTGELVETARRAMSTKPGDRYATVRDFQAGIRECLAHSESLALTTRGEQELAKAREQSDYQSFSRALFGFEEAHALWKENDRAALGILSTRLAYAQAAYEKGDYDLAAGLLDRNQADHAALAGQIRTAQEERDARKLRLRRAKRFAATLLVAVLVVGVTAYFAIRQQRDRALLAEEAARKERDRAVAAEGVAEDERDLALVAKNQATQARAVAEEAKAAEEYAAYGARIGLAAARIDENSFDAASELLDTCPPELRGWEWGRLKYLCGRSTLTIDAGAPVGAVAYDAAGNRCAAGGWNGLLRVWNLADGALLADLPYAGAFVNAVAFSPDGKFLAAGGSDKQAFVKLYQLSDGRPVRTFEGHTQAVLSVAFNREGNRLLTTSYDGTARLWDVSTGKLLRTLRGHSSWVWSAAFSPDEQTIVTTGEDGTAIVWPPESAKSGGSGDAPAEVRAMLNHRGPVHGVAFAPDGATVATGGADERVLLWKPADVRPYRLAEVFADKPPAPLVVKELIAHRGAVFPVAFSADGARLVSGGLDNALIVWDVAAGKPLKTLRGHAGQVRACRLSPDGKFVLSAGYDGTVKLWNVDEYSETLAVKPSIVAGHADAVLAADFSPDEARLVTAGRDRTARIVDARTLGTVKVLAEGHDYLASAAVVTADGKHLATAAVDGTTRIWNMQTGVQIAQLPDTGRNAALAVSTDGRFVLTGDGAKGAKLWDLGTGKLIRPLPPHRTEVSAVAVSPDGKLLFTGEASGRANVWNAETGANVWSELRHSRRITAALFTDDGKQLLTASLDNTVGRWNSADGAELRALIWKHPQGVLSLVRSGASHAATACEDGKLRLWNIGSAETPTEITLPAGKYAALASSTDGRYLAAVDQEARLVRLFDLSERRELLPHAADADRPQAPWLNMATAGGSVWSAAFTPDGAGVVTVGGNLAQLWDRTTAVERQSFQPHGAVSGVAYAPGGKEVATSGWDGAVKIWNTADGRAVRKLQGGRAGIVNSVAYSRDGRQLLTAGDDRTARLWDAATGAEIARFTGHTDRVTHAAFAPDGLQIVTASADKTARVWDVGSRRTLHTLQGHAWPVLWAEFSHDGKRIVTAGADDTANIWNSADGKLIETLTGHTAPVTSATFSPDDSRIATGSRDGGVKLWDAAVGKELLSLKGHTGEVTTVRFSPSGRTILSAGDDGNVLLWPTISWKPLPTPSER